MDYTREIGVLFVALLIAPRVLCGAPGTDARGRDPIGVAGRKQLLFDRRFMEASEGIRITMNPPVKAGPVLVPDKPWEDFRLTSYFTVVQDGGLCRMYYSCFSKDQWHTPDSWEEHAYLCYAESDDGLAWRKPSLGIVEFEGSKDNNIILRSVVDGTVFIDPHAPPERRYKLLSTAGPHKGGLRVSCSADGIHFNLADAAVSPWNPDSQQNAFWDERLGKYAVYLRGRSDMGIEVGNRLVVRAAIDDIEKDWSVEPRIVFRSDELDHPEVDFYTNACIKYPWAQEAYLMFPAAYHHYPPEMGNDGLLDTCVAASRDGIEWRRPDRKPYVCLGEASEWDACFVMMGVGLVRKGNRIYQYYSGVDLSHGGTRGMSEDERKRWRRWGKIGATVQRLDGFFSADAEYTGGWFVTPPLAFSGNMLALNINTTAAGMAKVAMLDAEGEPVPGFAIEDCDKIMGNDAAHVVTWRGDSDVSSLAGRSVRLRIEARSAKLYAFQFVENEDK